MKYVSVSELSDVIRKNLYKIPHDIDAVLGVPRSGMIPASIISELLNKPLSDINSFSKLELKSFENEGNRRNGIDISNTKKILVIDDTVNRGSSMLKVKDILRPLSEKYDFIYSCVFQEGPNCDVRDFCLADYRVHTNNFTIPVFYEWNIFHHYKEIMNRCIYDMDGVFCLDPPDERNRGEYEQYIQNAIPLITPSVEVGAILTYRLNTYRDITEKWLSENNIKYKYLMMFNSQSWGERNNTGVSPGMYKGTIYKSMDWALLFIESNAAQAEEIFKISGKPVLCVENNKLYC